MTITTTQLKQLSDGNPQGVLLGQSATDKIGFYGLTTPIVSPTVTAVTTGATATLVATMVVSIYTALVNLGLVQAG